jgi:D-alanyl-D-alanine dipeptidase
MKPYQQIPIHECGEPLVPIPLEKFSVESPHPYEKLGANYQGRSPYYLRQSVLQALFEAQAYLQQQYADWCIHLFDTYRPIAVQQFMVDYTFAIAVRQQGLEADTLSAEQRQHIWEQVYQLWAVPSENPHTPPPHSTGAALDVTLVDAGGKLLDMGGEIDELSARSQPNYYANSTDPQAQDYHARRQLLNQVMQAAGFYRHPREWWHFSLGDQMWAWQYNQDHPSEPVTARYGRLD